MAVVYSYVKYKDVHTISNGGVIPLTYTIIKVNCDSNSTVKTGVIAPDNLIPITFTIDGIYNILLDDGDTVEIIPSIKVYNNLLDSLITCFEGILCGCSKCNDCEECNTCEDYLQVFTKAFAFANLNYPLYQEFLDSIIVNTQCDLESIIGACIIKERVYGNADVKPVLIKLIRDYYTSFYYKDYAMAVDNEEKEYVATKYKAVKILKCIRQLGTVPTEILLAVESDAVVYYWQLDNLVDTITEVDAAITGQAYLDTKPGAAFVNFEVGKIVNYTNTGRIVFAISPTQIEDFIIKDSLNNDITDEFDFIYNNTLSVAIFVSKSYYNISSLYFKFKKDF